MVGAGARHLPDLPEGYHGITNYCPRRANVRGHPRPLSIRGARVPELALRATGDVGGPRYLPTTT